MSKKKRGILGKPDAAEFTEAAAVLAEAYALGLKVERQEVEESPENYKDYSEALVSTDDLPTREVTEDLGWIENQKDYSESFVDESELNMSDVKFHMFENQKEQIKYKFNEENILKEIKEYVDKTYDSHYGQGKIQAMELTIDAGHGEGFCIGNLFKYGKRYGVKEGYNRKDILKLIHYSMLLLHNHDLRKKDL